MSAHVSERSFQQRYLALLDELKENPQQFEVLASQGHCIALAGPGSGKTKTITAKVARLLNEEVASPRGIACITYSNECANEIAHRLSQLGIEPSSRFFLGTVHSFCFNHIARPYGAMAQMPIANEVATDAEQLHLKREALAYAGVPIKRATERSFDALRREPLSRMGVWYGDHPKLGKAIVYYERVLAERGKTDFNEMVRVAVTLVHQHPWVANVLRAKFPVIVVDEYQDLGYGLHRLVTRLQTSGVRLVAVGDPDQSIYAFAGAKPHWLIELYEKHLKTNEAFRLHKNYRCGQRIIDLSILALGQERSFEATRGENGVIEAYSAEGGHSAQITHAVDVILPKLVAQGVPLGEVGFLYPNAGVCRSIADVLTARGIAFRGGKDVRYPKTAVTEMIELAALWAIEGVHNPDIRLSTVLSRWRQVLEIDLSSSAGLAAKKAFVGYLWRHRTPSLSLSSWLQGLCALGIDTQLGSIAEKDREQRALAGLVAAASSLGPLHSWTLKDFAMTRVKGKMPQLVTIHSSKGLEYDVTIIIGLESLSFTNIVNDEDKRKLYVGLSRARKSVHLYWSGEAQPIIADLVRDGKIDVIKV